MPKCEICGTPQKDDLFADVTGDRVCSICKVKFIGGLPTSSERIASARSSLGLRDGDVLSQDRGKEAARILGRKR